MLGFPYHVTCPWCHHGEVLSDGRAKVTISTVCSKCGRVFLADLDTMHTERSSPQRRNGRKRRAS